MHLVPRTNSGKLLLTGIVWLGIGLGTNGYLLNRSISPSIPYTVSEVRGITGTLTANEKHAISIDSIAQQALQEYENKRPFLGLVAQLGLLAAAYGGAVMIAGYVERRQKRDSEKETQ